MAMASSVSIGDTATKHTKIVGSVHTVQIQAVRSTQMTRLITQQRAMVF